VRRAPRRDATEGAPRTSRNLRLEGLRPSPMPGAPTTMLKPPRTVSLARKHVLATRARDMRLHAQEPDRALWRELRGGQLGVAFRRQVVLGNRYIADFVAPSLRLVVEVDGAVHAQRGVADACCAFRPRSSCTSFLTRSRSCSRPSTISRADGHSDDRTLLFAWPGDQFRASATAHVARLAASVNALPTQFEHWIVAAARAAKHGPEFLQTPLPLRFLVVFVSLLRVS
jgi:hypothetical protein